MAGLLTKEEAAHADQRAAPLLAHGLAKELKMPFGAAMCAAGLCCSR